MRPFPPPLPSGGRGGHQPEGVTILTILLVEQDAQAALEISSRGYVLETGTMGFSDSGQNLLHNERLIEVYLGGKI